MFIIFYKEIAVNIKLRSAEADWRIAIPNPRSSAWNSTMSADVKVDKIQLAIRYTIFQQLNPISKIGWTGFKQEIANDRL